MLDPQTIYACFAANLKTADEQKSGLSEQTKQYLRQQVEAVTREREAEEREAKRVAALEKRRATNRAKKHEQEKEST